MQIGSNLPVKRVGEAQDIAKTFVYLLEQEYGTGQTLIIDGGTSIEFDIFDLHNF